MAAAPQDGTEAEELLEIADAAMYRAKASGRRMVVAGEGDTIENGSTS